MKYYFKSLLFKYHLAILAMWCLLWIIVNPLGEFPINDDWAYTHNVYDLSENGQFKFSPWPAMTLVTQTILGALTTKIVGFSFIALRCLTIAVGLITSLLSFQFFLSLQKRESVAFLGTLVVFCNPLFQAQSVTFMTEVYFLFILILAVKAYHRYILTNKAKYIVYMLMSTTALILLRQTGLILPIAFVLMIWTTSKFKIRKLLMPVGILAIGFFVLYIYKYWRIQTGNMNGSYSDPRVLLKSIIEIKPAETLSRMGVIIYYVGLALLPLSVHLVQKRQFKTLSRITFKLILGITLILIPMLFAWEAFPAGNVFGKYGLGPRLIKDLAYGFNNTVVLGESYWLIVKGCSIISIGVLVFSLSTASKKRKDVLHSAWQFLTVRAPEKRFELFLAYLFCGFFLYLLLNPTFFDRYTLPLAFIALLFVFTRIKKIDTSRVYISVGLSIAISIFAMILSRDHFEWQRARWSAFEILESKGVKRSEIDGGVEFNGWFKTHKIRPIPVKLTDKSWWFVADDKYLITSGEFVGYQTVDTIEYNSYFARESAAVYILEKKQ